MKKILTMAAIILINFILQTSLNSFLDIFGVIPNISLILVVIFSVMTNGVIGGILGLFTGMLYDIMFYEVFGIFTLIYFIIGVLSGYFSEEINKENYSMYCTIVFIATIVMNFSIYIISFFLNYNIEKAYLFVGKNLLELFLNTVLTILIMKFIVSLFNKLNIK